MPDIGATIRTLTLADSTVQGLVNTRMFSDVPPEQVAMPAIVYTVIDTVPNEHLGGIVNASRARIQIDCAADTRLQANQLGDAVRLALEKKHRGDQSGQFIHEISLVSGEQYSFLRPEVGSDERRFITTLDFFVTYRTTTS